MYRETENHENSDTARTQLLAGVSVAMKKGVKEEGRGHGTEAEAKVSKAHTPSGDVANSLRSEFADALSGSGKGMGSGKPVPVSGEPVLPQLPALPQMGAGAAAASAASSEATQRTAAKGARIVNLQAHAGGRGAGMGRGSGAMGGGSGDAPTDAPVINVNIHDSKIEGGLRISRNTGRQQGAGAQSGCGALCELGKLVNNMHADDSSQVFVCVCVCVCLSWVGGWVGGWCVVCVPVVPVLLLCANLFGGT